MTLIHKKRDKRHRNVTPSRRVLVVGPLPPQIGGIESFIGYLLSTQLTQNYDIQLLDISKPKVKNNQARYATLSGYSLCFRRHPRVLLASYVYSITFFTRFLWLTLTRSYDLLHLHTASYTSFWEKCVYISLARLFRRKVVLHVHGSRFSQFFRDSSTVMRKLVIHYLNKTDRVIALSQSMKAFFSRLMPAEKIAIVENGIDMNPFLGLRRQLSPRPSLVFLGVVGSRKGIFDLIDVASMLRHQGLDCDYHILGPGKIALARQQAEQAGVRDLFHFHGPVEGEGKVRLLEKSWCFVLPSYAEGMPLAILEAFAAGLPVVSTTVGGIPEVVHSDVNGYLVDPGDKEGFARMIQKLLTQPHLLEKISAQNRQDALSKYRIEAVAEKIDFIYTELLGQPAPRQ
jgi:glycosyltransferase involved in cell wall biosynthesis